MQSSISILIPTQGRLVQLQRLLDGLAGLDDRERIPHEIIIVNNARDQSSVTAVEAMVQKHSVREPGRWLHLREVEPGKSRALNSPFLEHQGASWLFSTMMSKSRPHGSE